MTNTNKMTYVAALSEAIAAGAISAEAIEKLEALKASIEKKSASKAGKPTKKQTEAEGFKATLLAEMEPNRLYGVAELAKILSEVVGQELSPSKVTPMLTKLKNEGMVENLKEKGKSFYRLAEVEEG